MIKNKEKSFPLGTRLDESAILVKDMMIFTERKIDDNVAMFTIRSIEFHASSFFKLDLSIATRIIASISITTYLICRDLIKRVSRGIFKSFEKNI